MTDKCHLCWQIYPGAKPCKGCWVLSSFTIDSAVLEKSKMWKVNNDGWRKTSDRNSAFEPLAQVH